MISLVLGVALGVVLCGAIIVFAALIDTIDYIMQKRRRSRSWE